MKNLKSIYKKTLNGVLVLLLGLGLYAESPALMVYANNQSDNKSDEHKPSDKDITSFVQMEFIVQDGVNWNNIDVETNEGIVTLSGKVDNILAKDRSVNIAKTIKGVRAVIDDIEVKNLNIPDDTLNNSIIKALLLDPATDSYEINPKTKNGHVTLDGKVESWQERELAAKVTKGVKGVRSVENNIYFDFVDDRTDSEIKNDIQESLRWDIRVDDGLLHVDVQEGKVLLSGTVGSVAEKSQAKVDSWVAGVREVDDSQLIISPWVQDEKLRTQKYTERTDIEIKKAVKDAFYHDPRVLSFNPIISVNDGKVTLSGHVDNLKAKKSAELDARNVVGVWKVNNLLKVKGEKSEVSDLKINDNISNALSLNPYVEKYKINILVDDGTVTLTGRVDNYLEKFQAEDVASGIYGVKDVRNRLSVEMDALPYAFDYNYRYYYPYGHKERYAYSPARSDLEIKEEIENQIWWSPFVNLSDVMVEVDKGIATLDGKVDSWSEYYLAEKNAFEGGALGVDNDMEIEDNK